MTPHAPMTPSSPRHVVVVGAGIVGTATAIWLRRFGADVTLIDRDPPGQGASFGNAGVLAAGAVVPVTTPGLWKKALPMLLRRDSPLFLRWGHLPKLAPFLTRYMSHATDADVREAAAALAPLTSDSAEQHLALTEGLTARRHVVPGEYLHAYADRAAFDADGYAWGLKAEYGFGAEEVLTGGAVQEAEPSLGDSVGCLAIQKHHGHITDPGAYVAALARDFEAMGGRVMRAGVKAITVEHAKFTHLETDAGPVPCDRAVIACGAHSAPLLQGLGLTLPLETERGYHLHFKGGSGGPSRPVMVAAGAFVATPMETGVRCAGVLEFGGLDRGPSRAPLAMLRRLSARAFPGLAAPEVEEWMGHRPALPDSLPVIGEVGQSGVHAALGHHHVGLTAGPRTGRLVAAEIMGKRENLDLTPYSPARFS
ncbi:NAD(P)/FAD-dependent oxidoreductase [Allosediminivita pacifica]|nr:FAD-dependent oxidoreductase [Allosediminivita pacifica]